MTPIPEHPTVVAPNGTRGRVASEPTERLDGDFQVLINFDSGQHLWVPAETLILQEDGTYRMNASLDDLVAQSTRPTLETRPPNFDEQVSATNQETTQPLSAALGKHPDADRPPVARQANTRTTEAATSSAAADDPDRLRVSKVFQARREVIDEDLWRDEVHVDRVPINEYVDEPPPIRYEQDRVIIPVLEEVLVVEKRLLLKEEVVVSKRRVEAREPQPVVRETEHVVVEPVLNGDQPEQTKPEAYRVHYAQHYGDQAEAFEYYEPAYLFGQSLRHARRYQDLDWAKVESEARQMWEDLNPGTWDEFAPAIKHGWQQAQVVG